MQRAPNFASFPLIVQLRGTLQEEGPWGSGNDGSKIIIMMSDLCQIRSHKKLAGDSRVVRQ